MRKILALLLAVLGVALALPSMAETQLPADVISFVDDDGRTVTFDKPFERIISFYSAHTENLYFLGAEDLLIGAHSTSTYPKDAAFLPRFDYDGDPEHVIAAEPDLVIVRPFISRRVPAFIEAMEMAGIQVVSMLPESLDLFDDYIMKLAMLTGREDVATEKLSAFHETLAAISAETETFPEKTRMYFESTENELRTVTDDSMAGRAMALAGGVNIAAGAEPVTEGSTIAAFGAERILMHADEIDVYVSQRGAMNAGGNVHSISIRPGFDAIRAVQDGRILLINEKLVSSPTFRYTAGVRELARFLYPDQMDDVSAYQTDAQATRRDLAAIVMRMRHLPIFVPTSSKYYETETKGHIYGMFEDIPWTDADYDAIETAVQSGFVTWREAEDGTQWFDPDAPVTRDALARSVFLMGDFESPAEQTAISDIDACEKPRIVQTLVDCGVFALSPDGAFEPDRDVTCDEIVQALSHIAP